MLIARKTSVRSRSNKREVQNKSGEATVYLYGDIGGWLGIDHQEWVKEFAAIDAGTIHLRVDSSGGDVFAARAMKTAIMQHPAKVIAHVDGLAASAASFMIMGADEIEIVDGGFLMIHLAMSWIDVFGYFNSADIDALISDLQREKDLHAKINDAIAADYVKRSGMSKDKIVEWMSKETWITAQEAVDNNLADSIYDGEPVEGSHDLSIYTNVPEPVLNRNGDQSKRAVERALRDAGLSNKEAKTIVSQVFTDVHRDDGPESEPEPDSQNEQRDVATPAKRDRIADLLIRAERMAPALN